MICNMSKVLSINIVVWFRYVGSLKILKKCHQVCKLAASHTVPSYKDQTAEENVQYSKPIMSNVYTIMVRSAIS